MKIHVIYEQSHIAIAEVLTTYKKGSRLTFQLTESFLLKISACVSRAIGFMNRLYSQSKFQFLRLIIKTSSIPNEAKQKFLDFIVAQDEKELNLREMPITTLPDIFSWEPFVSKLKTLTLSYCPIEHLPESIGSLSALETLKLSGTRIKNLPGSIVKLQKLQLLIVPKTLESFPQNICDLPSSLVIDLRNISDPRYLIDVQNMDKKEGPIFSFETPYDYLIETASEISLEAALKNLYTAADLPEEAPVFLLEASEEAKQNLSIWLSRLTEIEDIQNGVLGVKFYQQIVGYLRVANENPIFRTIFETSLESAATTCADRIVLSVLRLGLRKKILECSLDDLKQIVSLFKTELACIHLEAIAYSKIKALRAEDQEIDEVQIYLTYPIKLKESFGLLLDIQGMECPSECVTEQDLQEARDFVMAILNDESEVIDHLICQEQWREALKMHYPAEYEKIEQDQETLSEMQYMESLKTLTKRALSA